MITQRKILILLIIIGAFISSFAQESEKVVIVGDSFKGKKVGIYSFKEFIGNVVMTKKNVIITCDRAVQNVTLDQIELMGNVIITQDTIKIYTDEGFFYGSDNRAFTRSGIKMLDGNSVLIADSGYYFSDAKEAHFFGNVTLEDTARILNSDRMFYFEEFDSSIAVGNVSVTDSSAVIYSDSLIFLTESDFSNAVGNAKIVSAEKNLTIYAGELFNYGDRKYTRLTERPLMIKIDSTSSGFDTLYLSSNKMESFYDSSNILIAEDSVLLKRGNFSSVNDKAVYFRSLNKIFTYKLNKDARQPVLWYENSQMLGDSVMIYLNENALDSITVSNEAILISGNENFKFRFDQISGSRIMLDFDDGSLKKTKVNGNVLSIYYLYERDEGNGLIKSSGDFAEIIFEENKVIEVNMSGTPASEFHPENLVFGNEKEFTLPQFKIIKNRPTVERIIGSKKIY